MDCAKSAVMVLGQGGSQGRTAWDLWATGSTRGRRWVKL